MQKRTVSHQLSAPGHIEKSNKTVITLLQHVAEMSTAAKFLLLLFAMCHCAVKWWVTLRFFAFIFVVSLLVLVVGQGNELGMRMVKQP